MKKRVLFFIESLSGGGAEKVLVTLLGHFDYSKYAVTLLAVSDVGVHREAIRELNKGAFPKVNYRTICGDGHSFWQKLLYKMIYRVLPAWLVCRLFIPRDNDIYVAFVEGYCTKVLSYVKKRKIAWVHIDLKSYPWILEEGIYKDVEEERDVYAKYDKVVSVSQSVEKIMKDYYRLDNTLTIYNPIDTDRIREKAMEEKVSMSPSFNVISVGRLVKQKGYDLLIPIIAHLRLQSLDMNLYILGEGEERTNLEHQIKGYHLEGKVHLLGYKTNPYPYIQGADLFVCSSRAEGYSLVVAEALTLGAPVVSIRCSGPEEVLGFGKYGMLCDDYEQMETEIATLVTDKKKYTELGNKAELGRKRFGVDDTMSRLYCIL